MQKRRVLVVDLEAKGESQGLRMLSSIRQAGVFGELLLAGQGFSVPDNAAGLVLLGGEGPDLPVVQACVRAQIPLLCFGGASRLLVEALGGSVGETALAGQGARRAFFGPRGVPGRGGRLPRGAKGPATFPCPRGCASWPGWKGSCWPSTTARAA